MISQELARKGDHENVKLGKGGIREIEFIGQAFQLIRGGSEKSLQRREILSVLSALGTLGLLPEETVTELQAHYRTLRIIENRLQEYRDQQTHTLPKSFEQQLALAYALGFSDYAAFLEALAKIQHRVHQVFEDGIRADAQGGKTPFPLDGDTETLYESLTELGISAPKVWIQKLEAFRTASSIWKLSCWHFGTTGRWSCFGLQRLTSRDRFPFQRSAMHSPRSLKRCSALRSLEVSP